MSRSKNRKIADLISGTTFDDGVVAASEVTGLATVATSGSFSDLSNQPTPFDPSTLGTASTQATGAFATAAQGTTANAALPKAGGAVTGNVTFGDNDKVVMGAGSDLQIYHDGSHSRITDAGTGSLLIDGDEIYVRSSTGENKIIADTNGGVNLFYDNASKLTTTSTGIDVTGTVNADALTGIGSIDATTATAIGAAGVGGAVTFLGKTNITSTAAFIQVPLASGYKGHIVIFNDIRANGTQYNSDGRITLTNSGSTEITTNGYYSARRIDGDLYNTYYWDTALRFAPSGAETGQVVVTLWHARDSSMRTYGLCNYGNVFQSPVFGQMSNMNVVAMGVNTSEDNANLRLKANSGSLSGNSDSYSIWGIS